VEKALHQAALALLHARLDKTYSLCDAISFLLMRGRGLSEALTTDRHFEQEGFVRLPCIVALSGRGSGRMLGGKQTADR
jgi:predicted nucleic acid-binding protein